MSMHGPWMYGEWDQATMYKGYPDRQYADKTETYGQRTQERDKRKRSRSKSQPKEIKRKRQRRGPTDSDIEKTYTGMDRELAEEFIEQTMDPGGGTGVDQSQTMSGTESEA